MKKIVMLVILLAPSLILIAQKPVKPSLPKAEKAWRDGKLDEAKSVIDATTTSQEFMADKKGNPSKSAAKAWYIKALIYASLDTTSNTAYKGLAENPLATAKEAFEKCYAAEKGKGYYIFDATGFIPVMDTTVHQIFAQHYLNKAVKFYNVKDFKSAFAEVETVVYFVPNDTMQLFNAGVYFGPSAEAFDKSIIYINAYYEKGGKNPDAYLQLCAIYYNQKKDKEKTLETCQRAKAAFPHHPEFPKYELNIYVTDKSYDKAKNLVQTGLRENPNDKDSYYMLGGLYSEMGNVDSAKIAFQKCLELDDTFFDAQLDLATLMYLDAKVIKSERDKLGITPKELQKRKELFDQLQVKYKVALPYWERAMKLSPDNERVLFTLFEIYSALVMDDKAEVIRKRMKALGYTD